MTVENKRSAKITSKTSVYDKSIFEFLPNFLRINFYFDKKVLAYLDTDKQEKSSKLGSKKSSKLEVSESEILKICKTEKSLKEIAGYFGYKDVYKFKNNYINTLLEQEKLTMTIPEKPKSKNQKYIIK